MANHWPWNYPGLADPATWMDISGSASSTKHLPKRFKKRSPPQKTTIYTYSDIQCCRYIIYLHIFNKSQNFLHFFPNPMILNQFPMLFVARDIWGMRIVVLMKTQQAPRITPGGAWRWWWDGWRCAPDGKIPDNKILSRCIWKRWNFVWEGSGFFVTFFWVFLIFFLHTHRRIFWNIWPTVDGQNPAPPRMMMIPLFIGF